MHGSAMLSGAAFFSCYADKSSAILDVGSCNVNGSLRIFAPQSCRYVGVDMAAGRGVDVVLDDPHVYPFPDDEFDLVVSTSCLEHDQMFWLSFAEMARMVRPGGFVYLSVPQAGPYHGHPVDCWRFNNDAPEALAAWSRRCGHPLEIVECFTGTPEKDGWIDNVSIFGKQPFEQRPSALELLIREF